MTSYGGRARNATVRGDWQPPSSETVAIANQNALKIRYLNASPPKNPIQESFANTY